MGRWSAGIVWGAVCLELVALLVSLIAIPGDDLPRWAIAVFTAIAASFGAVGALIVTRRPRNAIGWILWAMAGTTALAVVSQTYAAASYAVAGGTWPATLFSAWVSGWVFMPGLISAIVFVPMLFPDGRLLSRRWGWLVVFATASIGVSVAIAAFAPGPLSNFPAVSSPVGIGLAGDLAGLGTTANALGTAIALPLSFLAVVLRYRRGTAVERLQVRWFAASAGLTLSLFFLAATQLPVLGDIGWLGGLASLSLVPVAIGIAILRYHLYDIDRIVSRAISYLIVTSVLAAVFVGGVILLQTILAPVLGENPVAVAASTLVVAALFQPLRRRVQAVVDRRFNRSSYDAERIVSGFSGRLRDEVDLTTLLDELDSTVRGAIAPASVGVWLRQKRS